MGEIRAIWRDTFVDLNTSDSPVNYTIYRKAKFANNDDEPIFNGKAWCPPSHSVATFQTNINKICEDYLYNEMTEITPNAWTGSFTGGNSVVTFYVRDDNDTLLKEVTFVYDWSFDDSVVYTDGQTTEMSRPINGRGVRGMYHFKTVFNGTSVSTQFSKTPTYGYEEVSTCSDDLWAIYYLNRYGGWDSYLIEGYVSRTDKFERKNIIKPFNNGAFEVGNKPYLTNITPTYEIHTGWMNDKESEILASNLLQTTRAYLHKLDTTELIPVVITDADVLYKNHKNSGRRLLNYTINVEQARTEYNKN